MDNQNYKKINVSILVVEDSLTQAAEVQYFLEENGYKVDVCHDGEKAFEWLSNTQTLPDVIVSDIVMPHLDGYGLCKKIRLDEKLKNIPVILLTSLSEPHDIIQSIEAGANKFLTKPFDHKRLPEVIDELYINTQRRSVERMEMGIRLMFGGKDFLITADKVQILDLLLSSYEDSYYKNIQLQESRSALERLNAELEQKVQERTTELKIKEEQFRTITEHTPDMIVRIDKNMNFVYTNKVVEELFDIYREELIGQPMSTLEEMADNLSSGDIVQELFKTKTIIRKEFEIKTPHGIRWIDSTFVPEFDENNEVKYVLKVSRDITELKEKDKIMMIQSRQAAMGDMIAMIAHQWRQPLSIISMEMNNIRISVELDEVITNKELVQHTVDVNQQIQQLSQTIEDFRSYLKPTQQKEEVYIADVLEKTMNLIQKSLENNNITVEIHNTSKTKLLTYSNQLLQVFINIINNAKDILLSRKTPEAKIVISINETKDLATISICDNGGGIPKDIINRLGEPYFTTKEINGTGLGLYMSKIILTKNLQGTLSWENKDNGACFHITMQR